MNEQELAQEIIRLHDTGLGYRRISQALQARGIQMNKDKISQIHNKHKNSNTDSEDEGLRRLKQSETQTRERLRLEQEREEVRKRLVALFAEQETLTFERRRKLFTDEKRLLRFAQKVMPVVDPMLWCEFKEFCEEDQVLDLADALYVALGDQEDFEALSTQNVEGKKRLDAYLCEGIRECVDMWGEDMWEEFEEEEETEPKAAAAKKEEYVTITFPAPDPM